MHLSNNLIAFFAVGYFLIVDALRELRVPDHGWDFRTCNNISLISSDFSDLEAEIDTVRTSCSKDGIVFGEHGRSKHAAVRVPSWSWGGSFTIEVPFP